MKKSSRKKEKEKLSSPEPVVAEEQASKKKKRRHQSSADNDALDRKNGIEPKKKLKLDTSGVLFTNTLILISCLSTFCFSN